MASDIAYLTFQVTTWSGKCSFSEERVLFCHPSSFLLGTSIGETWAFGGDALSSNLQWFYVTKSGAKLAIARFLGLKLRYRRLANLCSPYACEFWGRKHYRDSPLAGNEYIQPIASAVDVTSALQALSNGIIDKQLGYQMLGTGRMAARYTRFLLS